MWHDGRKVNEKPTAISFISMWASSDEAKALGNRSIAGSERILQRKHRRLRIDDLHPPKR